MARADVAELQETQVVLACFQVKQSVYALDVASLREVVRWQPTTELPKAPTLIDGVIDLRGAVIPVIDLGRALHGEASEPQSSVPKRDQAADPGERGGRVGPREERHRQQERGCVAREIIRVHMR